MELIGENQLYYEYDLGREFVRQKVGAGEFREIAINDLIGYTPDIISQVNIIMTDIHLDGYYASSLDYMSFNLVNAYDRYTLIYSTKPLVEGIEYGIEIENLSGNWYEEKFSDTFPKILKDL